LLPALVIISWPWSPQVYHLKGGPTNINNDLLTQPHFFVCYNIMSEQRADNVAKIVAPPVMYRYFKYLVPGEGRNPKDVLVLNHVSEKDDFIVHDESTQGYYLFDTYINFEDWYYDLDDKTMHEVIFGEKRQ